MFRLIKITRGLEVDVDRLNNETINTKKSMLEVFELEDKDQSIKDVFLDTCSRFMSQLKALKIRLYKTCKALHMDINDEGEHVRTSYTMKNFRARDLDQTIVDMTDKLGEIHQHTSRMKGDCVDKDSMIERLQIEIKRLTDKQTTEKQTKSIEEIKEALIESRTTSPENNCNASGRILPTIDPHKENSLVSSGQQRVSDSLIVADQKQPVVSVSVTPRNSSKRNDARSDGHITVKDETTSDKNDSNTSHRLRNEDDQTINFIRSLDIKKSQSHDQLNTLDDNFKTKLDEPSQVKHFAHKSYDALPKIQPRVHQPFPLRTVPTHGNNKPHKLKYDSNLTQQMSLQQAVQEAPAHPPLFSKSYPIYHPLSVNDHMPGHRKVGYHRSQDVEASYLPVPVPPQYRLDLRPQRTIASEPKIAAGLIKLNKMNFRALPHQSIGTKNSNNPANLF